MRNRALFTGLRRVIIMIADITATTAKNKVNMFSNVNDNQIQILILVPGAPPAAGYLCRSEANSIDPFFNFSARASRLQRDKLHRTVFLILVPEAGIEPAPRYNPDRILSPARLPVPPPGQIIGDVFLQKLSCAGPPLPDSQTGRHISRFFQ